MTKKNQKDKLIEYIKECARDDKKIEQLIIKLGFEVIKSYILGFSSGVLFVIILAFIVVGIIM